MARVMTSEETQVSLQKDVEAWKNRYLFAFRAWRLGLPFKETFERFDGQEFTKIQAELDQIEASQK